MFPTSTARMRASAEPIAAPTPLPAEIGAEIAALVRALREPPYHHVVPHSAPWLRRLGMERAMHALAETPDRLIARAPKLSFTRVQIDPTAAVRVNGSTHYSRTHLPLALHTDGSNMAEPHQLIAFHMIRSDSAGGDSTALPLPRLLDALPAGLEAALRHRFPFGRDALPILWGTAPSIRYYRAQIDAAPGGPAAAQREVLDELDRVLARGDLADRFRLADDDVLFVNNRRALHGRTGFAPTSGRLMLRYRIHAPLLD